MATIKISELEPTGLALFSDSESYMKEMTEGELSGVLGGACNFADATAAASVGIGLGGAATAPVTPTAFSGAAVGGVLATGIYATYCLS
jgi:hypothetical protein